MALNLHHLRIFFHVAQERSFSKAAECMYISQPAVSKAVRELEVQLGLPLVERGISGTRSARGVSLTDDGNALWAHAAAIFELEKAALDDIHARLNHQSGRLLIGASSTVAGYWLPHHLAQLQRAASDLDLRVMSGNTKVICQALLDYDVDIAVVEGAVEDERLIVTPWQEEALQIVAHPVHVKALERQLSGTQQEGLTWILREEGSGTRAATVRKLHELGLKPTSSIEFGSNEGIARAVAAAMGVAILPSQVVRELMLVGDVVVFSRPHIDELKRTLSIVEVKGRPVTAMARLFKNLLMEVIRVRPDC